MNESPIPFQDFRGPYLELKDDLDAAYQRFMESGWFVLGKETVAFEEEYASYCQASYCVGVSNGLDALHLALRALEIGSGDEVIVPSNTYIATWLAVSQAGALPVAVEPHPTNFNIDPIRVRDAISPRTRAILAVNLYGHPCDYDPLLDLAKEHGLKLIIDNAQAHGARYKGQRVGGIADMECHSFYPSKNLGAYGEAGAVTTNSVELAEKLKVLRNYGSRVRYCNEIKGYNNRIDELQAAFLRVKLRKLDEWNARRTRIADTYRELLADCPGLISPTDSEWADPVWHLFVVRHQKRDALQAHLASCGIQTLVHYPIPPHQSGAYAYDQTWHSPVKLIVAEQCASEILSLPIGPHLTTEQVNRICGSIRRFCF